MSDILPLSNVPTAPEAQPRWLTVSDHLALIAGFAIALALPPAFAYGSPFGVPAVAAFFTWRRGGRRDWIWTEWVGAGTAALLGMGWLFFYYFGSYEWPPTGWISRRIVTALGLVVTSLLSAQLLHCSGYKSASARAGSSGG